jgi:hypothetical protein
MRLRRKDELAIKRAQYSEVMMLNVEKAVESLKSLGCEVV